MTFKRIMAGAMLSALLVLGAGSVFGGGAQEATGEVTISFWSAYPEMDEFYGDVIDRFESENAGVKVELETFPIQSFKKKIAVALPSESAADILDIQETWAFRYVEEFMQPNPQDVNAEIRKSIRPEIVDAINWGGQLIGVPFTFLNEVLYWNKGIYAQAGLSSAPDTMDQLVDYARKLVKHDGAGNVERSGISLRLGGNPAGVTQKFWALGLIPYGADVMTGSLGKYHNGFNGEGGEQGVELYIDLLHKYKVEDWKSMKDAEAFSKEKTAMFAREQWVVSYMEQNAPSVAYGASVMPKGTQRGTWFLFRNMYVPRASTEAEQKAAWKLATFLIQKENAVKQVERTGWLSPRVDLDYESMLKDKSQLMAGIDFPKDLKLYWATKARGYDTAHIKMGEVLIDSFKKAELVDNPSGIAREIDKMADIVDQVMRDNNEYAPK